MTTPVNVLSLTFDEVQEAARAKTACTAIYLGFSFGHLHTRESLQSLNIETLKHDLGRILSVLRWIERWLGLVVSFDCCQTREYDDIQEEHNGPRVQHVNI
jgi:hypothetical protein